MVVTVDKVLEAQALAPGTSAQMTELIALMRALVLSQRKKVNIYIDSKYAFMVVPREQYEGDRTFILVEQGC